MLRKRILFVCLGNICRSPMAEGVFKQVVKDRKLIQYFELDSAGTGAYHVGSDPDHRAIETCRAHGIRLEHKARQVIKEDFEKYDYILAMDTSNYHFLQKLYPSAKHVMLMRAFDVEALDSKDVPDPYYGGIEGFQHVFEMLNRSSHAFLDYLIQENSI